MTEKNETADEAEVTSTESKGPVTVTLETLLNSFTSLAFFGQSFNKRLLRAT